MSESNVNYHEERKIKIDHFSKLSPKFDFWYWDAFKKAQIKEITER